MLSRGVDQGSIRTQETRRSTMSRAIPTFSLDTFSSKDFIVKDFVENLSESAIPASRRSGPAHAQSAFDPKPLIRTFESALSRLGNLSEDLTEQETDLSASVRRAESQHNQNVASLSQKLEQAIEQFNRLDSSLNAIPTDPGLDAEADADAGGAAALRIGERLEELERQRARAEDAKYLIGVWLEVSEKGSLRPLEEKRRLGGAEKVKCATIARQLLRICTRLDPEFARESNRGSQRSSQLNGKRMNGFNGANGVNGGKERLSTGRNVTRELIERFLESLEKDLLDQFDEQYRRQNFEGMKDCATALRDFNEGSSVMGMFVNQHQFFIDRSQLVTDEVGGDAETWDRIADPDSDPPGVEPGLQALIDEVRLVVQEESFIIKRTFPFYEEVLTRFLQRVFQQSIQQRLEMVLQKAGSISSLAFLRTLQASRSYISSLVDDLKAHGLTEHPEPVSSTIAAVLDQQLDDLFVPYLLGSSYIDREKKSLEELYSSLLFKFSTYHSRRKKMPTSLYDRLNQRGRQLIDSTREGALKSLGDTGLADSHKAMLRRIAGLKDQGDDKGKTEIEVTEEDGQLSLETAKRMLKWLAEGVGRGLELSGGNETPKDVQALLGLLLTHMGEIYLDNALENALDLAAAQENTKNEPDLTYLPSLRTTIQTLHLLQTSISTMLLPLATPNLTIRREIDKTMTATISTLEAKVSSILQRTIDATLEWVKKLLLSQKKSDFRPRDEDLASAIEALQTPTCLSIYTFLTRVSNLAGPTMDGVNLSSFLEALATGLRTHLLDHLRKFTVSLTGGLIVSKDITKYAELVRAWPLQGSEFESSGGMEVVAEVANLFVISAEALRERLRGAGKSQEEVGELKKFVERREDVGSVGVQAVLSAI
ncbi:exocyst complex component Sec10 [Tothia fuscella]|uniref:Exocyst complex component Sec10 n=1 Tax=Tothia fuscella TaxID=1048955 RepID=A0A9P4U3G6_9PEZI|nr:exocyst complex component Sec10 [Tothia fuscella]